MWETVSGIIRNIFFSLDKIVFGLIGDVYGLLLQICRTSVFDTDAIHSFSSRIYVFIGLFMLFKLSISLITYLLNPDDFAKGDKNFGKIIKNAILALVMIVLCPYIFTELFEFQSIILEENTIMNVAFGTPTDTSSKVGRYSNSTYVDDAGNKIQFTLAYTFAQPNYQEFSHSGYADLIDCKYTYQKDKNGNFEFRKKAVYTDDDIGKDSKFIYQLNPSCFGIYDPDKDEYVQDGINGQLLMAFAAADSTSAYQDYAQGVAQQSFSLFFKKDAINAKIESGAYVINYRFGISTAIAIGTLYLLLMFCIDLAVRSVKLGFLQMIAPVPILSYVDPKSGKDGMFNKWFKSVKNTYLDLFIRLFALYFGIYVITLVGRFRDVVTGEVVDNWIVRIFMIIGVLIFIKKLPEFLKDALGFEGNGIFKDFQLNPLRKLEKEMLGGGMLKKPADRLDMLARDVKGAPFLLGKKTLSGIDAKRNGQSFKSGWNRFHGELGTARREEWDKIMPETAAARKRQTEGRTSIEQRKSRFAKAAPLATNLNNTMDKEAGNRGYLHADDWKARDFSSYARYEAEQKAKNFKNSDYKNSFLALERQKVAVREAQNKANDAQTKYSAFVNGQDVTIGATTYHSGNAADEAALKSLLEQLQGKAAGQKGKQDSLQAAHDDMQKLHADDASVEKGMAEYGKSHEWVRTSSLGHGHFK